MRLDHASLGGVESPIHKGIQEPRSFVTCNLRAILPHGPSGLFMSIDHPFIPVREKTCGAWEIKGDCVPFLNLWKIGITARAQGIHRTVMPTLHWVSRLI